MALNRSGVVYLKQTSWFSAISSSTTNSRLTPRISKLMSTAADDDLGSFFSEIEQIEQSAPGDHAEDLEQKEEIKIAPPVEIVSKPQLISRNSDKALPMIHGAYGGAYSSSLAGAKVQIPNESSPMIMRE